MGKENIGQQLKNWRKIRGLKQKEVADRAGILPQNLYAYESGRRTPSFETLKAICDVLQVEYEIILRDKAT